MNRPRRKKGDFVLHQPHCKAQGVEGIDDLSHFLLIHLTIGMSHGDEIEWIVHVIRGVSKEEMEPNIECYDSHCQVLVPTTEDCAQNEPGKTHMESSCHAWANEFP